MKKLLFCAAAVLMLFSCKTKTEVEDTFFGVKFGMSQDEAVAAAVTNGHTVDPEDEEFYITDGVVQDSTNFESVLFGCNQEGKVSNVTMYSVPFHSKEEADRQFETTLRSLSSKYPMTELASPGGADPGTPSDTTSSVVSLRHYYYDGPANTVMFAMFLEEGAYDNELTFYSRRLDK
jgi:hypothetical protein